MWEYVASIFRYTQILGTWSWCFMPFGVGTEKIEDYLAGCQLYCGIATRTCSDQKYQSMDAWRLTRVGFVGLQRSAAVKKTLTS